MRPFRIVTDGSCDMPAAWCRAHDITVIPLYYSIASAASLPFPGGSPFEGEPFYRMLREGTHVRTSTPGIGDCKAALMPLLKEGFDILYTGLSSRLSGMFNVMRLAAMELSEEYPESRIEILDSRVGSLGVGLLLHELARARERGCSLDEAAVLFEDISSRLLTRFTVSDLLYLRRGGRIGSSAAVVGTVLRIMPMLTVSPEGSLTVCGKLRGRQTALKALADTLGEAAAPGTPIYLGHCDAGEDAAFVRDMLRRKYAVREVRIGTIGPVLGAHAGPGAVAGFCLQGNA